MAKKKKEKNQEKADKKGVRSKWYFLLIYIRGETELRNRMQRKHFLFY